METKTLSKMLSDKNFYNLNKMKYKYSKSEMEYMVIALKDLFYKKLPLIDFSEGNLVYLPRKLEIPNNMFIKFSNQNMQRMNCVRAMGEEIEATLAIENIYSSKESIRNILKGFAPKGRSEEEIYGMKKGLDFISDKDNRITEENIFKLYNIVIADFLEEKNKLEIGNLYRHDDVYVVGDKVKHKGLESCLIKKYMGSLIDFACDQDDNMNQLVKSAIIHYYFAYIHPYFDGNGRMARLLHIWYLIQEGFPAALYTAFSKSIMESKTEYYKSYEAIKENSAITKAIDVTLFVDYFIEKVYMKVKIEDNTLNNYETYNEALSKGLLTNKEKELWEFVIFNYGNGEFSTKQLERDFSNAAYGTIRNFVLKFESLGLLTYQKMGNRGKYRVL